MDRHRQEWLDYSCSEEVWLINSMTWLADLNNLPFLRLIHLLYYIFTEQRCNLWRLLKRWQLQWFLYPSAHRGCDLPDSSTKRVQKWRWACLIFCVCFTTMCGIMQALFQPIDTLSSSKTYLQSLWIITLTPFYLLPDDTKHNILNMGNGELKSNILRHLLASYSKLNNQ